ALRPGRDLGEVGRGGGTEEADPRRGPGVPVQREAEQPGLPQGREGRGVVEASPQVLSVEHLTVSGVRRSDVAKEVKYVDGFSEGMWTSLAVKAVRLGWAAGLEGAVERLGESKGQPTAPGE